MSKPAPAILAYPAATIKLVRVPNLVLIVFTQYFGRVFITGSSWKQTFADENLLFLSFSSVLIAAAGYIINDYYDVKIDIINKPDRLVVGKVLSRRQAIFLHTALNLAGIILGLLVSPALAIVNFSAAFLLWWYSNYLKRLPLIGNISVSFLSALTILVLALIYPANTKVIAIYAGMAFLISLAREIIKDMEDIKGDRNFGCRTLPIAFGLRKTKRVLYAVLCIFWLFVLFSGIYLGQALFLILMMVSFLPSLLLAWLIARADTKKDFRVLSSFCKLIMAGGILSMIFL